MAWSAVLGAALWVAILLSQAEADQPGTKLPSLIEQSLQVRVRSVTAVVDGALSEESLQVGVSVIDGIG